MRINKNKWIPYIIFMPALLTTVGILIPFLFSIMLSFTNYSFRHPVYEFYGIKNWVAMFVTLSFWKSLLTTLIYAFSTTLSELSIGLGIAMLLYKFSGKVINFLKVALIVPLMVAPVIGTLIWQLMLNSSVGIVEKFLNIFNIYNFPWASSPNTALMTVAIIDIWIYTPFVIILALAGLNTLPKSPFESAQIDGGSSWFVFKTLMFPMLKPFLYVALIFRLMASLQEFAIIYALTKGGPGDSTMALSLRGYSVGFSFSRIAAAMPYLLVLWAIIFFISNYLVKKWLLSYKGSK